MYQSASSTSSFLQLVMRLNWFMILLILLISSFGFLLLYSAAHGDWHPWAIQQIKRFAVLFPGMLLIAMVPIRFWYNISYIVYGAALLLLVLVEFYGHEAMGATRWLHIGPITVQPSELMKVALVFALSRYFHTLTVKEVYNFPMLILPVLLILIPAILILKQPDLGTAIIVMALGAFVCYAAGIKTWKFVLVGVAAVSAIPLMWKFVLKSYQKERILTFLDPERDPLGSGYNIIQSKIAIGSGGMTGKGFLQGTQTQLQFLPEHQTDFIFTVLAEEWGFLGGAILLLAYAIIILLGYRIAMRSENHFGRLLALGIISLFFLHIFINIAMIMGLLPVVGVPLPLMSYGGTIMAIMLGSLGLLLSVHSYKDVIIERFASRKRVYMG